MLEKDKVLNCTFLHTTGRVPFRDMIAYLIEQYKPKAMPVRMVFFGNPAGNGEYCREFAEIKEIILDSFGENKPSVSYVAQPPCNAGMMMEVHEVEVGKDDLVNYKEKKNISYLTIENANGKRLYLSGVTGNSPNDSIGRQSETIFGIIDEILLTEQLSVSSITRQWNYIEQITGIKEGKQNYQEFNDARTSYYDKGDWVNGYPAATGIGTLCGGVMVDINAETGNDWATIAIDNPLQIPAHVYSEKVLVSEECGEVKKKTTPKFERAKAVETDKGKLIYISGTAAIRGENSLKDIGINEQVNATLENIEYLISIKNGDAFGADISENASPTYFRVYMKYVKHYDIAREIIYKRYPNLPVGYVIADVCRPELLIEIEGMAVY